MNRLNPRAASLPADRSAQEKREMITRLKMHLHLQKDNNFQHSKKQCHYSNRRYHISGGSDAWVVIDITGDSQDGPDHAHKAKQNKIQPSNLPAKPVQPTDPRRNKQCRKEIDDNDYAQRLL
jgi:hypothetical protein